MKALIFNNEVVQVSDSEFEVHEDYTWMDCDADCKNGWVLKDGKLADPVTPEQYAADAAQEYARNRKSEYPSIPDQMDMIYKDNKNSTTTHATAIEAVKTKWPKDNSGPV